MVAEPKTTGKKDADQAASGLSGCSQGPFDSQCVPDEQHNWFCKELSRHPGAAGASRKHIRALEAHNLSTSVSAESCDKELHQRPLPWELAILAEKSKD